MAIQLELLDGGPQVALRNAFRSPYADAIAAARSCYSARVIGGEEITPEQKDTIGPSTFDSGHHTVYQHATFEFSLSGISRQFVWSFLHGHPFYNSEQSSQRYVKLKEPRATIPPLSGPARDLFCQAIARAWQRYAEVTELLRPTTEAIVAELRHLSPRSAPERHKRVRREAEKRALEAARYVLPIAAHTSMVHTVSGLTLHRLRRLMAGGDCPWESALVISRMVAAAREVDPDFFDKIGEAPLRREQQPEDRLFQVPAAGGTSFRKQFDARLGPFRSRLVDYTPDAESQLAAAVRAVFALEEQAAGDTELIDRVVNPARNPLWLEKLNLGVHSPLLRTLQHPQYTFIKRLSHTADSQDQRHRMVPASRPLLRFVHSPEPDAVCPALIAKVPAAVQLFDQALAEAWQAKNRLLELGVDPEFAVYVLPNATAIRLTESGNLLHLLHKWHLRTCFNAQEEIYYASVDEIRQVRELHPNLMRWAGPPCLPRANLVRPICTEGIRFCGVKVWQNWPQVERQL